MNMGDIGMDSVTLSGPLAAKLAAIRAAGFSQVMLRGIDLNTAEGGTQAGIELIRNSGLRCTGLQVLRDFEGLSGRLRAFKTAVAREMLQLCVAVESPLLLVCSSTLPYASGGVDDMVCDLRLLADMAHEFGVKIAYEALSWGHAVNDITMSGRLVSAANRDNLGVALDSFHHCATNSPVQSLETLPAEKIFLVQLSDFLCPRLKSTDERILAARHHRVFPGDGAHDAELAAFIGMLHHIGYGGDYSLEVMNDDYLQLPQSVVANRARLSALWIKEQAESGSSRRTSRAA